MKLLLVNSQKIENDIKRLLYKYLQSGKKKKLQLLKKKLKLSGKKSELSEREETSRKIRSIRKIAYPEKFKFAHEKINCNLDDRITIVYNSS